MRTYALGLGDAGYPEALRALRDPPRRLYVRGGVLPARSRAVAVVGSRAATPYGRMVAERLAHDLARCGLTVVSGLARGIDAAAHSGALAGEGPTVAVIPSALDHVTPATHSPLADRIVATGALVSEIAEGGPFGRGAFVKRNRIIAGLAAVTVVVEAAPGSGALTTAAMAHALGRVVLAVPGDVDRPGSRGTLALLRAGARPCADAGDVLAALASATDSPSAPVARGAPMSSGAPMSTDAANTHADAISFLREALAAEPRTVEALALLTRASAPETLARLLRLEWSGLAVAHPGGRWSART